MKRPRVLKDLEITEVSSVDRGAGRGVRVTLFKRDGGGPPAKEKVIDPMNELVEKVERAARVQQSLRELAKRNRDADQAHTLNFGEALDRSGALELMSEKHRLEKEIAKAAAKPQGPPPGTRAVDWPNHPDSRALPRGGADSSTINQGRLNSGANVPGSDDTIREDEEVMRKLATGQIKATDPRVSEVHRREMAQKMPGRLAATGY
jgi:hypothetical protein